MPSSPLSLLPRHTCACAHTFPAPKLLPLQIVRWHLQGQRRRAPQQPPQQPPPVPQQSQPQPCQEAQAAGPSPAKHTAPASRASRRAGAAPLPAAAAEQPIPSNASACAFGEKQLRHRHLQSGQQQLWTQQEASWQLYLQPAAEEALELLVSHRRACTQVGAVPARLCRPPSCAAASSGQLLYFGAADCPATLGLSCMSACLPRAATFSMPACLRLRGPRRWWQAWRSGLLCLGVCWPQTTTGARHTHSFLSQVIRAAAAPPPPTQRHVLRARRPAVACRRRHRTRSCCPDSSAPRLQCWTPCPPRVRIFRSCGQDTISCKVAALRGRRAALHVGSAS